MGGLHKEDRKKDFKIMLGSRVFALIGDGNNKRDLK